MSPTEARPEKAIIRSVIASSVVVCFIAIGGAVVTVKVIESKLEYIEKTLFRHEQELGQTRHELGETNKRQSAAIANRDAYNRAIDDRLGNLEGRGRYENRRR